MSETDSFIEEVTEEVRRDRMYALLRRYGWILIVVILVAVGGTAWQSWKNDRARAASEALGDSILSALEGSTPDARAAGLDAVLAESPGADATRRFLQAAAQFEAGAPGAARETLLTIENNPDVPMIYRQIASFKALAGASDVMDADARRAGFEALSVPGSALRLLAEEQLGLIEVETGAVEAAIARFQAILNDAETTAGLQQRAAQVIVALGGEPELNTPDQGGN